MIGRTELGVLGAVTGGELAETVNAGSLSSVRVAPRTLWSVGRVIQDWAAIQPSART